MGIFSFRRTLPKKMVECPERDLEPTFPGLQLDVITTTYTTGTHHVGNRASLKV